MPICGGTMFKFRATLTLGSSAKKKEIYENGPDLSSGGAYRTHGDDYIGRSGLYGPPKKLTPSMVKLPQSSNPAALKTSKSASNLTIPNNIPPQLTKSTPDISTDPRGGTSNNRDSSVLARNATTSKDAKTDAKRQEKERKELEKKRLAEQKKREKAAAQEQARQDKLRIQRDRQIAQQQARDVKMRKEQEKQNKKKGVVAQPAAQASVPNAVPQPSTSIPPPPPMRANPLGQQTKYNTLESSISRSSGPPPYAEVPKQVPNKRDNTGNTSFAKPIEESSWDMISEHRHQISKTVASGAASKQMMMDLQYSFEKAQIDANRNNSEA